MEHVIGSLPAGRSLGWAAVRRLSLVLMTLAAAAATGQATAAWAAEPPFRIGPDDVLAVSVWDQKDLDQVVTVRPDGRISLPLVGEVQAAGLTVAELADRLTTAYSRTVRGAQVTVAVREIRSRPVFLVGNVVKPGPVQLIHEMTVLQALSAAGGPTPTADLESAFVLRGDQKIPVNLQSMVQRGDTAQNLKLQPRDTLVIPAAGSVYVQGEVKTPGQVKYTQNLTVVTAIAAAGGFTPLAQPKRVTVMRDSAGQKQVFRVNVNEIMSDPGARRDVPLMPNDVVVVPQRLF
jgi:polysaccharide export outer membrane protein